MSIPNTNIAKVSNSDHDNNNQIWNTFVVPGTKLFYMVYIFNLPTTHWNSDNVHILQIKS